MALTDKLTAIADAIRAKGGTSDLLTLNGMVEAINAISAGGGTELPSAKLLCTLATEMNLYELLTAHPVPIEYKNCILFLKVVGKNVATNGSYTVNWHAYFIWGENGGLTSEIRNQYTGLVAPDSVNMFSTINGANGSYAEVVDDHLTASSITNTARYYAAGNSIYYLCVPFDYINFKMEVDKR